MPSDTFVNPTLPNLTYGGDITPRPVYQPDDMRAITGGYERKMIGFALRLRENLPTTDPAGDSAQPEPEQPRSRHKPSSRSPL